LDLSVCYEAEVVKRKLAKHEASGSSEPIKIPFTVKMRKFFGRRAGRFVVAYVAVTLLFIILGILSEPNSMLPDTYWGSAYCNTATSVMGIDVYGKVVLLIICTLKVAKSLRDVQDNHFKKFEIKALGTLLLVLLVWWCIGQALPEIWLGPIATIFYNQIPNLAIVYISFFDVARRARFFPEEDGTQSEIHRKQTAGSSRKASEGGGSSPSGKGIKTNEAEVLAILEDERAFADFEEYLSKEFCVEELFFLRDVKHYKQTFPDMNDEKALERCKKLYEKYIDEHSALSINISGPDRSQLGRLFAANATEIHTRDVLQTCFDKAYSEVLSLLAVDSFRRYKLENSNTVKKSKD